MQFYDNTDSRNDLTLGGDGLVGIGNSAPTYPLDILYDDATSAPGIQIRNVNGGVNSAANIFLYADSSSPANDDEVARFTALGNNDAGANVACGVMRWKITLVAAGSNQSDYEMWLRYGGLDNQVLDVTGPGILSVDLSGTGTAAQVNLMDDYDDALEVEHLFNRSLLGNPAVRDAIVWLKPNGREMWRLQPTLMLIGGATYQNKAAIIQNHHDIQSIQTSIGGVRSELDRAHDRIAELEARLSKLERAA